MSSRERRPSVFAFSSGAWPCGIANYHRHLAEQLSAQLSLETLLLPTERVSRSRPLTLWRYRRCYRRLAALADRADAVLLQLVSFWNGTRAGEHMLPAFWARLRRPVVTVLHEWPQPPEPEHYAGPAPVCWAKRLTTRAAGLFDYGAGGYDGWLASSFLGGTAHFIVHSKELRDRLADSGVDRTRLSWTPCPAFPLPAPRATGAETAARWTRGRRPIVLFGFPHPRKRYDVALQALARMGDEFVLVQVGSAEGAFRGACLQQLRRLAADLGVADRFVPTGEVDTQTMADLFHAAEIAWAPAEYATGSSSLGYLASAGLPIVASDIPGHRQLVDVGCGITLVPAGSADSLARTTADVLARPEVGDELRARNRRFAAEFTFARLAATVSERVRDAIGPAHQVPGMVQWQTKGHHACE